MLQQRVKILKQTWFDRLRQAAHKQLIYIFYILINNLMGQSTSKSYEFHQNKADNIRQDLLKRIGEFRKKYKEQLDNIPK